MSVLHVNNLLPALSDGLPTGGDTGGRLAALDDGVLRIWPRTGQQQWRPQELGRLV
jgi:hypothetical protein